MQHQVFMTGGTGYMGRRLIPVLTERGHQVTALVRPGSEMKIKAPCEIVTGNALDGDSYRAKLGECDTFIHLVGVPHPSPAKAREFVAVDLRSAQEAIRVATIARVRHFIYLSVTQPAPVMKAYINVRATCEMSLRDSGLHATILRPWYVLGPGHRWPVVLKPFYRFAELVPSLREGALRLSFVTIDQMIWALTVATEEPALGIRTLEVPEIRRFGAGAQDQRKELLNDVHIGAN
jgi:nucleoside-diphosphate-sugar epimerase